MVKYLSALIMFAMNYMFYKLCGFEYTVLIILTIILVELWEIIYLNWQR